MREINKYIPSPHLESNSCLNKQRPVLHGWGGGRRVEGCVCEETHPESLTSRFQSTNVLSRQTCAEEFFALTPHRRYHCIFLSTLVGRGVVSLWQWSSCVCPGMTASTTGLRGKILPHIPRWWNSQCGGRDALVAPFHHLEEMGKYP